MELDNTLSSWEFAEYEPTNVHICEKEFHDYVVVYIVRETSIVRYKILTKSGIMELFPAFIAFFK